MDSSEELVTCFKDTIKKINTNKYLLNSTQYAVINTRIYNEEISLVEDNNLRGNIEISEDTSFYAAHKIYNQLDKIAVLNFASPVNPGGGVMVGATNQEECLCRSSNLLPCLKQNKIFKGFYMKNRIANNSAKYTDSVIYSPGVTVFKDDADLPQMLPENEWFSVDVITCAAPNCIGKVRIDEQEVLSIFKSRIRNILNSAITNKAISIILGAFGCGAFKNPPTVVAKAFYEVLIGEGYRYYFNNIIFAIKSVGNKNNYFSFKNVFGRENEKNNGKNIDAERSLEVEDVSCERLANDCDKSIVLGGQCPNCGAELSEKDKFCIICGNKINKANISDSANASEVSTNEMPKFIDNRYKIIRKIGRGNTSTVYMAQDVKLERICAVKVVNKNTYANKVASASLLEEANKIKNLAHISIPQLYDIFDEEDRLSIVMEFIDGKNLSEIINTLTEPLDEATLLNWGKQLCRVLYYLHTLNPPHIYRDLKPANIIYQPNGIIKLIDFGIMRNYDSSKSEDTVNFGTKGFAAPEQFGGRGQSDARTDIYGFGMTLYSLATCVNPENTPFELKPLRELRPELSENFELIVSRCIEIDRVNRYENCLEILSDLEKC